MIHILPFRSVLQFGPFRRIWPYGKNSKPGWVMESWPDWSRMRGVDPGRSISHGAFRVGNRLAWVWENPGTPGEIVVLFLDDERDIIDASADLKVRLEAPAPVPMAMGRDEILVGDLWISANGIRKAEAGLICRLHEELAGFPWSVPAVRPDKGETVWIALPGGRVVDGTGRPVREIPADDVLRALESRSGAPIASPIRLIPLGWTAGGLWGMAVEEAPNSSIARMVIQAGFEGSGVHLRKALPVPGGPWVLQQVFPFGEGGWACTLSGTGSIRPLVLFCPPGREDVTGWHPNGDRFFASILPTPNGIAVWGSESRTRAGIPDRLPPVKWWLWFWEIEGVPAGVTSGEHPDVSEAPEVPVVKYCFPESGFPTPDPIPEVGGWETIRDRRGTPITVFFRKGSRVGSFVVFPTDVNYPESWHPSTAVWYFRHESHQIPPEWRDIRKDEEWRFWAHGSVFLAIGRDRGEEKGRAPREPIALTLRADDWNLRVVQCVRIDREHFEIDWLHVREDDFLILTSTDPGKPGLDICVSQGGIIFFRARGSRSR